MTDNFRKQEESRRLVRAGRQARMRAVSPTSPESCSAIFGSLRQLRAEVSIFGTLVIGTSAACCSQIGRSRSEFSVTARAPQSPSCNKALLWSRVAEKREGTSPDACRPRGRHAMIDSAALCARPVRHQVDFTLPCTSHLRLFVLL